MNSDELGRLRNLINALRSGSVQIPPETLELSSRIIWAAFQDREDYTEQTAEGTPRGCDCESLVCEHNMHGTGHGLDSESRGKPAIHWRVTGQAVSVCGRKVRESHLDSDRATATCEDCLSRVSRFELTHRLTVLAVYTVN
jgi:hypothetical protein